jgi:EmrB/QacA subfamily drug resistance transporter
MHGEVHEIKRENMVLFIIVLGTLMGAVDSTIVLLAFPVISESLHSDIITTLWIILAYLLIIAVTTIQVGRIGDIYGRSKMFMLGFTIFTVTSALCGLSPTILILIVSRAVQAVGAALMQSNSGAIVADTFPRNVQGKAFGYTSLGWTTGAMLGIILGGTITTFLGWRLIFLINIPIGAAAIGFGLKYVRDVNRTKTRVDFAGMILLGVALFLLSYGATDFAGAGMTMFNFALIMLGVFVILFFIFYDRRLENPMIDFKSFQNRVLRNATGSSFFVSLGYLSVAFLIIMYLQGVRGLSPLDASVLLIPGYVAGSFLAPIMGRLSDKYGSRAIASLGVTFLIGATFVYLTLRHNSPFHIVVLGSVISGIGTSMYFPANTSAVMEHARTGSYGSISGLLRTIQNIGILGSYVLAISVASISIPRNMAFAIFIGTTNLSGGLSDAFIRGIDSALYASVVVLIVAVLLSLTRGKEQRTNSSMWAKPIEQQKRS